MSESERALSSTSAIGLASARAREIVGVLPFRQSANFRLLPGSSFGSAMIERAISRAPAGLVAVETQQRLVRHFPEQPELLLGQRGAERRDGRGKARSHHRDHVDIAFDRDDRRAVMRGLARGWRRYRD